MKDCLLKLKLNPYPYTLTLWKNADAIHKHLQRISPNSDRPRPTGRGYTCTLYKEMHIAIGIFERCPGILVHETLHAVAHMFDDLGIPITGDNDEAAAYMQQWMFNHCWAAMRGRRIVK